MWNFSCIHWAVSIRKNKRPFYSFCNSFHRASPAVTILWMNSTDKIAIQLTASVDTHTNYLIYIYYIFLFVEKKKFPLILALTCLMTEFVFLLLLLFYLKKKRNKRKKNPIYTRERVIFFPGTITCKCHSKYICNQMILFKYLLSANWLFSSHIH